MMIAALLSQQVLICGVCKDVEKQLPYMETIIEQIGSLFADYRVVIYENNSTDRTPEMLQQWVQKNGKIEIQCEFLSDQELEQIVLNKTDSGAFFRPELIARGRNIVLEKALSPKYEAFPYVIWIDMDFSFMPDIQGFVEIFTADREWDGVLAYGVDPRGRYWDWYALRNHQFPFGPELLGMEWYKLGDERETTMQLTRKSDWFPVYSAFGGCGVYKKSSIAGCSYSGIVTKDMETLFRKLIDEGLAQNHMQAIRYQMLAKMRPGVVLSNEARPVIWRMNTFTYAYPSVCEHVPFHASMIVRGHDKLFINPRLVFRYGEPK